MSDLVDKLGKMLARATKSIGEYVGDGIKTVGPGILNSAVDSAGSKAGDKFAHDAAQFNDIINTLENVPTTTVEEVEEWLDIFDKKLAVMKHSPTVEIPTKAIFQKFYKPMIDHLELKPHSDASPELLKVIGFTAGTLALGLAAYAAGMVVETLSLGQIDGFDKFWDQIVKATGIYRISGLMTSLPLQLGVLRPMGYEYNKYYRTYKPKLGEAVKFFGRGHIGDNGFKDFMGWHGIEDSWFYPYKRSSCRETSYFMLNAIAREGLYDEDQFAFWLSDAGYGAFEITTPMLTEYEKNYGLKAPGDTQINFLLKNYRAMSEKAEFSGIQSLAKKAYLRGEITELEFRTYLDKLGKPLAVIDMIISAANVEKEDTEKDLSFSIKSKLYRLNRITEAEFRGWLKELGYSDENIQGVVYLEDLKKQDDPKELTRAQIEEVFKRDLITESEYRARLKNMNYSDEDINLMVKNTIYEKQGS